MLTGGIRPDYLPEKPNDEATVDQLLRSLGDYTLHSHKPDESVSEYSVERGAELVINGKTRRPKGNTKPVSKHFQCIACHNLRLEDPDLSHLSPDTRLYFVSQHDMAFLPGSGFYGLVNRTLYFNGDYKKQFGDRLGKARTDLREAIRFCTKEFARGRNLADWEVESILAYLWTLELKTSDIQMSKQDMLLYYEGSREPAKRREALKNLKSKYPQAKQAHFVEPPEDRIAGNQLRGRIESGSLIYELSCLHCHTNKRFSSYALDKSPETFELLNTHFPTHHLLSCYELIRYGTKPPNKKKPYMPAYTLERMSRQQVEDLKAYISTEAGG